MKLSRKINFTAHGINKDCRVLHSDEDFEKWYQEQFDLTMFSEMDVRDVMEEERPEYYPCIPLLQEGGYEVAYLAEDLVELWFQKFGIVTLSHL
jgi:hypothetical protein